MDIANSIVRKLDAIAEWSGKITKWLVICLMLVVLIEVVGRKVFNHPFAWSTIMSSFFFGYFFLLGFSYVLLYNRHVSVEAVFEYFPEKMKHIVSILCLGLFACSFCIIFIYATTPVAIQSWLQMEQVQGICRFNISHFRTLIPVAFLLLLLQVISHIIKHAVALKKVTP